MSSRRVADGWAPKLAAVVGLALVVGASGCGTKEDATLNAFIREAALSKGTGPFGAKLEGSARVELTVGSYAPSGVKVTSVSVQLERDGKQILSRAVLSTTGTVPVDVPKGGSVSLPYTIKIEQLKDDEPTVLCAGPVTVTGSVTQDGATAPQRIASAPLTVSGCP